MFRATHASIYLASRNKLQCNSILLQTEAAHPTQGPTYRHEPSYIPLPLALFLSSFAFRLCFLGVLLIPLLRSQNAAARDSGVRQMHEAERRSYTTFPEWHFGNAWTKSRPTGIHPYPCPRGHPITAGTLYPRDTHSEAMVLLHTFTQCRELNEFEATGYHQRKGIILLGGDFMGFQLQ